MRPSYGVPPTCFTPDPAKVSALVAELCVTLRHLAPDARGVIVAVRGSRTLPAALLTQAGAQQSDGAVSLEVDGVVIVAAPVT